MATPIPQSSHLYALMPALTQQRIDELTAFFALHGNQKRERQVIQLRNRFIHMRSNEERTKALDALCRYLQRAGGLPITHLIEHAVSHGNLGVLCECLPRPPKPLPPLTPPRISSQISAKTQNQIDYLCAYFAKPGNPSRTHRVEMIRRDIYLINNERLIKELIENIWDYLHKNMLVPPEKQIDPLLKII